MEEARVRKSQRHSVLCRHLNTLERYRAEEDVAKVQERLKSMQATFEELEDAHYSYHECLTDDEGVQASEQWFHGVSEKYLAAVKEAHAWLNELGVQIKVPESVPPPGPQSPSAGNGSLSAELAAVFNIPRLEIPTFQGDPKDYNSFITVFDQVVGNVLTDDNAKLTHLIHHLSGDALASVKSCILMGSAGYAEARESLLSRFGNSHLVTRRIIEDLKTGKSATRPKDLLQLADDLTMAHKTLVKLGAYGEINSQEFIHDILQRCHSQLRGKWRKIALQCKETKGEYPDFDRFVKFVKKYSSEASDPVYGFDAYKFSGKPAHVNTVSAPGPIQDDGSCCVCHGAHSLFKCAQFKSMRPQQRLQLARSSRLCFGCLSGSHFSRECPNKVTCSVEGCTRRHSKWLHTNSVQMNGNGGSGQVSGATSSQNAAANGSPQSGAKAASNACHSVENPVSGSKATLNACHSIENPVYLPIVPLLIEGREPTFAVLDSGSTTSLISSRLARDLGLHGDTVSCSLSTVGARTTLETCLVSFDVAPLHGQDTYHVRNAYVVSDIPAEIPTGCVDVANYPHLSGLPLGHLGRGVKAEVLIGMDNSDLLRPIEVRCDKVRTGQPYATLTQLGWALQGPVGEGFSTSVMSHHVMLEQINWQEEGLCSMEHESGYSGSIKDHMVSDLCQRENLKKVVADGHEELVLNDMVFVEEALPGFIPTAVNGMRHAGKMLHNREQSAMYSEEKTKLQAGYDASQSSSVFASAFVLVVLVGVLIVVCGSLGHAPVPLAPEFPVVLPPRHPLSRMILQEARNMAHLGTEWVLSHVRQRYWIPGARNVLRYLRSKCVTCHRLYSPPMTQKMADLPLERCTPGPVAFRHVGVDLFGPFYVKYGRAEVKRYGCVFTCFSVRAIHLEVLASLETDTFINGFVRFCARRGYPQTVKSDRGTNLVGSHAELCRALRDMDQNRVVAAARRMEVEWTFNPPHGSHQGGVWERMIRTVRRVLQAVLSMKVTITDEILSTVFCEVENLVNSRPITKCSEDVTDELPLTPNHLLLLEGNYPLAWGVLSDGETYRKRWKQVQSLVGLFWKRWTREYLPELQRRQKWQDVQRDLKKGDLVLLVDEQMPRGLWPLALVTEVQIGRDGHVRSARLKVRGTELVRPITKIVLLEMA